MNKVADKFGADLDRVLERATTVLAEEFSDSEQRTKRRDQFVVLIHQHETAVLHKASKLKLLVDMHANELLETLADVRDAELKRFEASKTQAEKCAQLTEGFRRYALEVGPRSRLYTGWPKKIKPLSRIISISY